jgi:hypothetical protein
MRARVLVLFLVFFGAVLLILLIGYAGVAKGSVPVFSVQGLAIGIVLGAAVGIVLSKDMAKRIETNTIRGARGSEWLPYLVILPVIVVSPWLPELSCHLIGAANVTCWPTVNAAFDSTWIVAFAVVLGWIIRWEHQHKEPLYVDLGPRWFRIRS